VARRTTLPVVYKETVSPKRSRQSHYMPIISKQSLVGFHLPSVQFRDVRGSGPSMGWVGSRNLDPCTVP